MNMAIANNTDCRTDHIDNGTECLTILEVNDFYEFPKWDWSILWRKYRLQLKKRFLETISIPLPISNTLMPIGPMPLKMLFDKSGFTGRKAKKRKGKL